MFQVTLYNLPKSPPSAGRADSVSQSQPRNDRLMQVKLQDVVEIF